MEALADLLGGKGDGEEMFFRGDLIFLEMVARDRGGGRFAQGQGRW